METRSRQNQMAKKRKENIGQASPQHGRDDRNDICIPFTTRARATIQDEARGTAGASRSGKKSQRGLSSIKTESRGAHPS